MLPLQKEVIARAANLKQTTITNFMVEQAFSAAQQILADQVHFYLSPEKWDEFCAALDAPPKDLPALRKLLTEPGIFDGARGNGPHAQPRPGKLAATRATRAPARTQRAPRSARSRSARSDGRK